MLPWLGQFLLVLSVQHDGKSLFMDSFLTDRAQLKLDAAAVYTALGVNERLFICTSSQVEKLVRSFFFFLKSVTIRENLTPNRR